MGGKRQNMYPSTWKKNMHVYQNFEKGLNVKAANENLFDQELPYVENMDISTRGSLKRRNGMVEVTKNYDNLIHPFKSGAWVKVLGNELNSSQYQASPTNATGTAGHIARADHTNVPTGKQVTIRITVSGYVDTGNKPYIAIRQLNSSGAQITNYDLLPNGDGTFSYTFTTDVNLATLRFDLWAFGSGTFTWSDPTISSDIPTTWNAQGLFRYYHPNGTYDDIVAINGRLYKNGYKTFITGHLAALQTDRPMNAVQHEGKLYIATGTVLAFYDGQAIYKVEPYKPKPLEALYVGLNGLASDPNAFISNGVSTNAKIEGVVADKRYGVANEPIKFTTYYSKPDTMSLEFKFERRLETHKEGYWMVGRDWHTDPAYMFYTDWVGNMQLRISIREVGTELILDEYILPKYLVKTEKGDNDEGFHSPTIQESNQIFSYWGRLYLYGDPKEPDVLYASDIENFSYFPITNTLRFENPKREGITEITRYRDSLIVFTDSTIQKLDGKTPREWVRSMVNSGIGCIAPRTVQAIENKLYFLSREGVFMLKSDFFRENNMNVERLDDGVEKFTVVEDRQACSVVHDNQYHIIYPSQRRRMRYYFNDDVWTNDTSDYMKVIDQIVHNGVIYGLNDTGLIFKFDRHAYKDIDHVFNSVIETKAFTFGEPYNPKKVREVHVMIGDQTVATNCTVDIFVDDDLIQNFPISVKATTGVQFEEDLTDLHKLRFNGKGYRTKIKITHSDNNPLHFVGLGFVFKVKKPK